MASIPSKRIVIPTYIDSTGNSDLRFTNGWEKKYLEDENFDVVIYEKAGDLINEQVIEDGVVKIPNVGRSSFAFLWHIVNNYDDLLDTEVFTKTHVSRQQIDIDMTIKECHKFYHLQAINYYRMMLYVTQQTYDKHFDVWKERGKTLEAVPTTMYLKMVNPKDAFKEIDIKFMAYHCEIADALVYPKTPGNENYDVAIALKEVFGNDYTFPYPFCLRRENVWSVKRDIIRSHSLAVYKHMLQSVTEAKDHWNMSHDAWCEFWPLFWEETIRRSGLSK